MTHPQEPYGLQTENPHPAGRLYTSCSSELEADRGVGQAVAIPVDGVVAQDLFFGRIAHDVVQAQAEQQQLVGSDVFPKGVACVQAVAGAFALGAEAVGRKRVEKFVQLDNPPRAHGTAQRKGRVAAYLAGKGGSQLVGDVVERRQLAAVFQPGKPFAAPRIGVGQLERPALPGVVEVGLGAIAVAVARHDVLVPSGIFDGGVGAQGHDVAACLVVSRYVQLSVLQKVLPAHFVVLRRARPEAVDAGHAEVGGQGEVVEAQVVVELLHPREVEVEQLLFRRLVFQREAGLDAVVGAVVAGQVAHEVYAHLGHEAERAGGRQVVGQLGVVVVGGVVHAAVFGQQVVEEVEPAAAGAHQVGQLVLEDGPLEGDACGRHVERQGADVLLQVTFLEVDFGDRREPALEAGGEETFVEDHAPDGIAVEHGQQGVDVAGVVDWHAVQQELVFVAAAAVHLEVAAGGEARHARQYPDLREQVVAAERQEVRRRELAQLAAVLVRLHSDLGYLEQLGRERGAERAVAVHTDGLGVGLIAHVADVHAVVTLGQVEAEAPVGIGQGVPLAFFAVVQHHDGPIEPFAAAFLRDAPAEAVGLRAMNLDGQFARRDEGGAETVAFQHQGEQLGHGHLPRSADAAGLVEVDERGVVGQGEVQLAFDVPEPLQDGSGRGGHLNPLFRYRLPGRDFLAVQQRGK